MTVLLDRPRGILIVTLASLGVNLFFAGILAGQFLMRPPPPHGPDPGHFIEHLSERLPSADAEILRRSFASHQQAIASAIDQAHGAREEVRTVLENSNFDPSHLQAALNRANAENRALETSLQQMMTEAVLQMSSEGRRQLAEIMPVGPPGPPPGPPRP